MSLIPSDLFKIDIPILEQENIIISNEDRQQFIEMNNKFIKEGYDTYVNILKNEIYKVIDNVRSGKITRVNINMDNIIDVTIDDKNRKFPFHFFHYGKKGIKWDERTQPWIELDKPQFPFKELQKALLEKKFYLYDMSDRTMSAGLYIYLSPKELPNKKLWHGFDKI